MHLAAEEQQEEEQVEGIEEVDQEQEPVQVTCHIHMCTTRA